MTESKIDYLDEDETLRNQNYVCISFLNPEDVLKNKEAYYFSKFIENFSKDTNELFNNLKEKFPDQCDIIESVKDNHKYIFDSVEMNEQLNFFKNVNSEEIEKDFHKLNNFKTSIRGIKVRGVYDNIEQAKKRCEFLKSKDPYFHIYVAQVGCWLPYESNISANVESQEYNEDQLNLLMKNYKQNKDDKDIVFDERKTNAVKSVDDKNNISDEIKEEDDKNTVFDEIKEEDDKDTVKKNAVYVSTSELSDELNKKDDPWLKSNK